MSVAHYLTKLVRHSAIYGVADVLGRAMGFLLIPFYTRALPQEAFGQLEILHVFQTFGVMVLSLGQVGTLMRFFSRSDSEEDRARAVAAALPIVISSSVVFLALLFFLAPWLATRLLADASLDVLFFILSAGIIARIVTDVPLTLFRLREASTSYGLASLCRLIFTLVTILVLVVGFGWGLKGVIVGEAVGAIVLFLVLAPNLVRKLLPFPGWAALRKHLRFGWPLVVGNLGVFVLLGIDKIFLASLGQVTDVAIYSIGGKFFVLLNILVFAPFSLVWGPLVFRISQEQTEPEARRIFSRLLTYFCVVVLVLAVGLVLFSREILWLAAPAEYAGAISVVPILLVAALCQGANKHFQAGLHITGFTRPIAASTTIAAVVNIVGNYLLIPPFGILGAAVTSAVSYVVMCVVLARTSYQRYPVHYEWKRIATLLAFAALVGATALHWNRLDSWMWSGLGKAASTLVFPLALWFGGFFSATERREAVSWLKRLSSREQA